jgi:carboxyl-terminal processing protease
MNLRPYAALAALALIATSAAGPAKAAAVSAIDMDELGLSYQLLNSEFYKRVDDQAALNGARNSVIALLKKEGVTSPTVVSVKASDDRDEDVHQLQRLVSTTADKYGAKIGTREITYSAISGLLGSVNDKYTVFLDPKEYAALNEGLDRSFSGVGIVMQIDPQTKLLNVGEVVEGGPAEKAGVKAGDVILQVDGHPTKGLSAEDDSKMLRGRAGTVVRLNIQRDGKPVPDIAVTRATIHEPSVSSRMLPNDIGYARLAVFGASTARELSTALDKLQAQGAKAYVLDLRYNGGGYLDAAIDVSSKFIPSGPIVSVQSRGGSETEYDAENTAITARPLAVLVNGGTASASEITSGAIQDSGVGELVGERTYGKGVVQTIHPLPDGSAVKITSARYLTPKGRDINTVGIQPDIVAPAPKKDARLGDPQTDTQLQAAITLLQKEIAQKNATAAPAAAAQAATN